MVSVAVAASVPPRATIEPWRVVVGVVLATGVVLTVMGGAMRRHHPILVRHTVVSSVLALSSGLIPVVLSNSALMWIPFLGMMSAAGSGFGFSGSVLLAVVPIVGSAHEPG